MAHQHRINLSSLYIFLENNKSADFRQAASLRNSSLSHYNWTGLEAEQANLIEQLKKYRYLLLILPNGREDLALKLMATGQSSLTRMAQISNESFVQRNLHLFEGDQTLARQVHERAVMLVEKARQHQQVHHQSSIQVGSHTDMNSGTLETFLRQNQETNFRVVDLLHSHIDTLNWAGLEPEKAALMGQLKAYQRMLRIVPQDRDDLARILVKNGFHSSLQITSLPKQDFLETCQTLFDDAAIAEQIYARAIALRKAVALQYVAKIQQTEPHVHTLGLLH